jgi:hypothetical protein
MNYRALGSFGFAISLALASSHAYAQDDEEAEEKVDAAKGTDKPADAKVEGAASAAISTEGAPKAEAKAAETTPAAATTTQVGGVAESGPAQRPPVYGARGDWFIQPYGYARFDAIEDSTQSFDDGINPNLVARAGTYRGDHRRATFTARDSRLGVFIGAPAFEGIKTSGQIELDFYGLQVSDAKKHDQVVFGPVRIRHAYVKLETSIVDVIAGQYFDVFGWGSYFYPATVAYLGVPGQVYHRNPQLRLEKKIEAGDLEVMAAVAAVRPGQRDAGGIPDGEAGLKLAYKGWSGIASSGFGRAAVTPVSLGVSGIVRHFEVPAFRPEPGSEALTTNGYGVVAQALLPVIPAATLQDKGNSLTATGEFSFGTGIAEMYTGMDGGSRFPLLPNPSLNSLALVYPQNVDPGLVTIDRYGRVKSIDWKAIVVGAQYYLPIGNGRVWLSGIYSRIWSDNIKKLTPPASWGSIFTKMEYIDASLGVDITPALAMGVSYQTVKQTFGDVSAPTPIYGATGVDGVLGVPTVPGTGGVPAHARNNRGMFSMAFFF